MRIILLLMATTSLYAGYYVYNNYYRKDIEFKGASITINSTLPQTYKVKVADSYASREKGLMHVKEMPEDEGMIFIYESNTVRRMWMKNTFIPLDMLFVSEDMKVLHIHKNAVPHSEEIISSLVPVKYTIELNAGQVEAKNIQVNDKIELDLDSN